MSELTRKEKAEKLEYNTDLHWHNLGRMTDQEINNLYEEHFNKVTEEDFEGFGKVWSKYDVCFFSNGILIESLDDIKKELGL